MQWQLEQFYMHFMPMRKTYLGERVQVPKPIFPFTEIKKDARVIIYGAGKYGQVYVEQNNLYHFCEIVRWVDKNHHTLEKKQNISNPKDIESVEYDYIIIAVQIAAVAEEIKCELLELGVPEEKIVWSSARTQSF